MVLEIIWPTKRFFNSAQVAKLLGKPVNPENAFRPEILQIRGGNDEDIKILTDPENGFRVKKVT